jgi:surface antigen
VILTLLTATLLKPKFDLIIKPQDLPIVIQTVEDQKKIAEQKPVIVAPPDPEPIEKPVAATKPIVTYYDVSSNLYEAGQCTWLVKNMRPDIPNDWGNAATWVYFARINGWATGYTPRVGAVGQSGNHVVYVLAVYGNGTILIREMNYDYVAFHQRDIIMPAANYTYIY